MECFSLQFWRHSTVNSNYEWGISYSVFPHCAHDIEAKTFWLLVVVVDAFFPNYFCVCFLHSFTATLCTISSPLSCQDPNPAVKSPQASVGCKSGDCVLVLQELQKHHWRPWSLDFPPHPNCCLPERFPWGRISILKVLLTCCLLWCLLHPSVGNCPGFRTCSESPWASFHYQILLAPGWGVCWSHGWSLGSTHIPPQKLTSVCMALGWMVASSGGSITF